MENDIARKAYREIYDFNKNLIKNQEIIINEKDPKYCYHLLENVILKRNIIHLKNARINELVKIIETDSFYFIMMHERYRLGSINRAQKFLLKNRNLKNIIFFTKLKGVDKDLLFEKLLETKNISLIEEYIKNVDFNKMNYSVCYFL